MRIRELRFEVSTKLKWSQSMRIRELRVDEYGIKIPSPEDKERGNENEAKLYGSVYSNLLSGVEDVLIKMLLKHKENTGLVLSTFSGRR